VSHKVVCKLLHNGTCKTKVKFIFTNIDKGHFDTRCCEVSARTARERGNAVNNVKTSFESSFQKNLVSETLDSEISGSHSGEYKDGCLLGCCAVWSGRSLPTFQRCLLPPSSGREWGSKHLWNDGKLLPDNPEDSHLLTEGDLSPCIEKKQTPSTEQGPFPVKPTVAQVLKKLSYQVSLSHTSTSIRPYVWTGIRNLASLLP
jgi:hypothetical protein